MRLAIELVAAIDRLPGRTALGPTCRSFARSNSSTTTARSAVGRRPSWRLSSPSDGDLGVVLVHNPILAQSSRVAAAHAIAIATRYGKELALRFHAGMFARPGPVSPAELEVVTAGIGLDPRAVAREAEAVAPTVKVHADLAAALGFGVTPSFVLGSVGLLGYPGPTAMRRFTLAAARCGDVLCADRRCASLWR